jgi:hypothetical protein
MLKTGLQVGLTIVKRSGGALACCPAALMAVIWSV